MDVLDSAVYQAILVREYPLRSHRVFVGPDCTTVDMNPAEVAEMADALASGVSGLTPLGVQIPPSALFLEHGRSFAG